MDISSRTPLSDGQLPSEIARIVKDVSRRSRKQAPPEEQQDLTFSLIQELKEALISRFLPGVNLKVAHDIAEALVAASGRGGDAYHSLARRFAAHAGLLHAGEEVVRRLSAEPVR
ncbi:hypothetical protein RI138_31965 [Streptomyces sp. C11-1]|uniref:Uncharacterized protein n=1 Tax=Streptomyces durocortorensis TaxID=2811104 RepID=A0ABY9W898_9ACTN|nr:hypothetical protein [Streptomyces durocortorensis]WNF31075.1 hypothetical protein RI138_31965 [Streptomyces durocortorensis]